MAAWWIWTVSAKIHRRHNLPQTHALSAFHLHIQQSTYFYSFTVWQSRSSVGSASSSYLAEFIKFLIYAFKLTVCQSCLFWTSISQDIWNVAKITSLILKDTHTLVTHHSYGCVSHTYWDNLYGKYRSSMLSARLFSHTSEIHSITSRSYRPIAKILLRLPKQRDFHHTSCHERALSLYIWLAFPKHTQTRPPKPQSLLVHLTLPTLKLHWHSGADWKQFCDLYQHQPIACSFNHGKLLLRERKWQMIYYAQKLNSLIWSERLSGGSDLTIDYRSGQVHIYLDAIEGRYGSADRVLLLTAKSNIPRRLEDFLIMLWTFVTPWVARSVEQNYCCRWIVCWLLLQSASHGA